MISKMEEALKNIQTVQNMKANSKMAEGMGKENWPYYFKLIKTIIKILIMKVISTKAIYKVFYIKNIYHSLNSIFVFNIYIIYNFTNIYMGNNIRIFIFIFIFISTY